MARFGPDGPEVNVVISPGLMPNAGAVSEEEAGMLVRAMCESMDEFLKAHEVTQEVLEMKISF